MPATHQGWLDDRGTVRGAPAGSARWSGAREPAAASRRHRPSAGRRFDDVRRRFRATGGRRATPAATSLCPNGSSEHRRQRAFLPRVADHPLPTRRRRSTTPPIGTGGHSMKAVQLGTYDASPELVDVADPEITSPLDVIVKIGGAGVCRTDLHIIEGQWAEKTNVALPYTLGHENAGWVSAVGSAVS